MWKITDMLRMLYYLSHCVSQIRFSNSSYLHSRQGCVYVIGGLNWAPGVGEAKLRGHMLLSPGLKLQKPNRHRNIVLCIVYFVHFCKLFKMHLCPRLWKRLPQVDNVPNISLDRAVQSPEITFIRWKVHQDWVSKVKDLLLLFL